MLPRVERAKSWETVRKTSGSGKRTATEKGADQVVNRVRYGSATPSAESSKAPRYEETTTAEKKEKMQELFAQLNKEGGSWHKTVFIKARSLYHKQQAGRELSPVEADFFRLWATLERKGKPSADGELPGKLSAGEASALVPGHRLGMMLAGAMFRTPVIGALRLLGTKMAAGSGALKALGSLVVFICALAEFDVDLRPNDDVDDSRPHVPLEPSPLPKVLGVVHEKQIPVPGRWKASIASGDVSCHRHDAGERVRQAVENGLHATAHAACVGRDGTGRTRQAKVVSVERVENLALWKQYWHRKYEMLDEHRAHSIRVHPLSPPARTLDRRPNGGDAHVLDEDRMLDQGLNECFLYHGTSPEIADVIVEHGFDERVAALSGLYGAGVYFANQSCKSAQYAQADHKGEKTLIVARVVLGDPYYAIGQMSQQRRPPMRNETFRYWQVGTLFDSVVANVSTSQAHRELIVYDHRQAYPEYVVRYREG